MNDAFSELMIFEVISQGQFQWVSNNVAGDPGECGI